MKPKPTSNLTRIGFFLIHQFSMLSMSAVVEPLRMANRLSKSDLYEWSFYSKDGLPVRASNGIDVAATRNMSDTQGLDTLIVVAGIDVKNHDNPILSQWLRALYRRSITLGSTSTGTVLLARAKLLHQSPCTIHWENIESFKEEFPLLNITGELYEMDRHFMTCSGGLSGLDMMLQLITQQHGLQLAKDVAEQCIHPSIRSAHEHQRMATQTRLSIHHPALIKAIELMHRHTESPIAHQHLADMSGLSLRQMERLFKHHFGLRPAQYYLNLRLKKAQLLLQQTSLSTFEVATACGFNSTSYLAKRYRLKFSISPRQERLEAK
ncbi:GlxA family transcriptional regulator [Oceanospirillaceae bacterium]|jgi:transcriptional regulator GlxA family with amidase domain|nr:GlxA family transcriptional regulator [Oceanospirillaceae bacterium]|tara:strand:- start:161 stop:1126 length:966 start_codon:yes stop_codon:yes gene_type:complete